MHDVQQKSVRTSALDSKALVRSPFVIFFPFPLDAITFQHAHLRGFEPNLRPFFPGVILTLRTLYPSIS